MSRKNPERDAIIAELNRHGVEWFERDRGRHPHIVLRLPTEPFIPFSSTGRFDGPITRVARSTVRRVLRAHKVLL
jgi:hypothetical protein